MKTKIYLLVLWCFIIGFSSCNKENEMNIYENEPDIHVSQEKIEMNAYAGLDETVQAIIRSLDLSMRGLPANVNEITIAPTGAIDPAGETRMVIATGTFTSAILIKAQDLSSANDLATGTITGNGMMGFTTLTIPAYNAAGTIPARVIGFFYMGSTNQWELFHFETQAPDGSGTVTPPAPDDDHVVLSTGRHVAKWDYGMSDWASAMGIDSNYNTRDFYNSGQSDGTHDNFSYRATRNTGCNAYNEPGFAAGTWCLPTWDELQEICSRMDEIGSGSFTVSPYWSSTETAGRDGGVANYVRFPYNWAYELGNKYLTNQLRVRCVHP